MSYEVPGFKFGNTTANADLRTKQFCFAKVTGVNQTGLAVAADRPIGVIQNKPNTGEAVELMVDGVSKVAAGAAITAGDKVAPDATSRAITFTSSVAYAAGEGAAGIALETATAAGQIIAVLLGRAP